MSGPAGWTKAAVWVNRTDIHKIPGALNLRQPEDDAFGTSPCRSKREYPQQV